MKYDFAFNPYYSADDNVGSGDRERKKSDKNWLRRRRKKEKKESERKRKFQEKKYIAHVLAIRHSSLPHLRSRKKTYDDENKNESGK